MTGIGTRTRHRGTLTAMLLAVWLATSACRGGDDDMSGLDEEADRLVEVVQMAADATEDAGTATVLRDRQSGPCDPGRASVDDPMGTSVVHAVEITDLDPASLDDVIQRVAEAWGVEVRPQDVTEEGSVVHHVGGGVTVSATSDKVLGRLSVSGETGCHPDA